MNQSFEVLTFVDLHLQSNLNNESHWNPVEPQTSVYTSPHEQPFY